MSYGELIGYHHWLLLNSSLCGRWQLRKKYRESMMTETLKQFSKSLFKIQCTLVDQRDLEQTVWIVLALFCSIRYFNSTRHLFGERASKMLRRSDSRKDNISLQRCFLQEKGVSLNYSVSYKSMLLEDLIEKKSSTLAPVVSIHFVMFTI